MLRLQKHTKTHLNGGIQNPLDRGSLPGLEKGEKDILDQRKARIGKVDTNEVTLE